MLSADSDSFFAFRHCFRSSLNSVLWIRTTSSDRKRRAHTGRAAFLSVALHSDVGVEMIERAV